MCQSSYQADGDAQEASHVERSPLLPLENPIERFATRRFWAAQSLQDVYIRTFNLADIVTGVDIPTRTNQI
jgi:hypothetical protein